MKWPEKNHKKLAVQTINIDALNCKVGAREILVTL